MPVPFGGYQELEFSQTNKTITVPRNTYQLGYMASQFGEPSVNRSIDFFTGLLIQGYNENEEVNVGPLAITNWAGIGSGVYNDEPGDYYCCGSAPQGAVANIAYKKYRYPLNGTTAISGSIPSPNPITGSQGRGIRGYDNQMRFVFTQSHGSFGDEGRIYVANVETDVVEKLCVIPGMNVILTGIFQIWWDLQKLVVKPHSTFDTYLVDFTPVPVGDAPIQTINIVDLGDATLNQILYQNVGYNDMRIAGDYWVIPCLNNAANTGPLADPFMIKIKLDLSEYFIVTYTSLDPVILQMFEDAKNDWDISQALFAWSDTDNLFFLTGQDVVFTNPSWQYAISQAATPKVIQPSQVFNLGCWSPCNNLAVRMGGKDKI